MELVFRPRTEWALPPCKAAPDARSANTSTDVYAQGFRWLRQSQMPNRFPPFQRGREFGWIVPSPVDVTLQPVEMISISAPPAERAHFAAITGLPEYWPASDGGAVASPRIPWLRLFETEFPDFPDSMFVPAGNGYVEWRLGWDVALPEDHYLLVLPLERWENVEVPMLVLGPEDAPYYCGEYGMRLFFRPRATEEVRRRQPIARLALLHRSSLETEATIESETA